MPRRDPYAPPPALWATPGVVTPRSYLATAEGTLRYLRGAGYHLTVEPIAPQVESWPWWGQ